MGCALSRRLPLEAVKARNQRSHAPLSFEEWRNSNQNPAHETVTLLSHAPPHHRGVRSEVLPDGQDGTYCEGYAELALLCAFDQAKKVGFGVEVQVDV